MFSSVHVVLYVNLFLNSKFTLGNVNNCKLCNTDSETTCMICNQSFFIIYTFFKVFYKTNDGECIDKDACIAESKYQQNYYCHDALPTGTFADSSLKTSSCWPLCASYIDLTPEEQFTSASNKVLLFNLGSSYFSQIKFP